MSKEAVKEELMKDQRVIDEINRHLWIESEKAGYDIGFKNAADDWFKKFADEWIKVNAPELKAAQPAKGKRRTKKRGAKSFLKK